MDKVALGSKLKNYLASQAGRERADSGDGSSPIKVEALKEVVELELPYEGAWAVKIIQAIVASGGEGIITVEINSNSLSFNFSSLNFSLDEFSECFYSPNPAGNKSLHHLLVGLWSVALKDSWGFQLGLTKEDTTLIWDGRELRREKCGQGQGRSFIVLAPLPQPVTLSWVQRKARSASRNADILKALEQKCCACPLPLIVDGRRIDCLQKAEYNKWSAKSFPLAFCLTQADLPSFGLAPGTFEERVNHSHRPTLTLEDGSLEGWELLAAREMRGLSFHAKASLAYLLCVHIDSPYLGDNKSSDVKVMMFAPSKLYWVQDGAVIAIDDLIEEKFQCQIGCFISAQGLKTDLTTLNLVDSPEKKQRHQQAVKALAKAVKHQPKINLGCLGSHTTKKERLIGAGLLICSGALAYLGYELTFLATYAAVACFLLVTGGIKYLRARAHCDNIEAIWYKNAILKLGQALAAS